MSEKLSNSDLDCSIKYTQGMIEDYKNKLEKIFKDNNLTCDNCEYGKGKYCNKYGYGGVKCSDRNLRPCIDFELKGSNNEKR